MLAGILVLAGAGVFAFLAVPTGTGLAAKQLCSLVFVSRMSPEQAMTQYVNPLLGPLPPFLRWTIDPATKQTRVSAMGFAPARAVAHPGYGCIQLLKQTPAQIAQMLPVYKASHHEPEDLKSNPQLQDALDAALARSFTQAVLVAHKGQVIAEAYAPGVGPQTPLPAWSMTKSVTATIAGMLVARNALSVDEVGLFTEWEDDDRVHISFDQLLRMTSGIDITETHTGADPNSQMLFQASDSAGYAMSRGITEQADTSFNYTSGSTVLAAKVITNRLGGPRATFEFIHNELLKPLGMHNTALEPDEVGTFIGSSFMMASARDWARFGQLYLNRGEWHGAQLFKPDWVDYVTRPTEASGERSYGAGFWLASRAAADHPLARWPEDTFIASGLQSNRLVVIPSHDLLIVRLGATRKFQESGVVELVNAALDYSAPTAD